MLVEWVLWVLTDVMGILMFLVGKASPAVLGTGVTSWGWSWTVLDQLWCTLLA